MQQLWLYEENYGDTRTRSKARSAQPGPNWKPQFPWPPEAEVKGLLEANGCGEEERKALIGLSDGHH